MNDAPNPNRNGFYIFGGLLLGLLPIPILLLLSASHKPVPFANMVVVGSLFCCLAGGICCFVNVRSILLRVIAGLFLGMFFAVLTTVVVIFQACSK